jgi:hypothetical protein
MNLKKNTSHLPKTSGKSPCKNDPATASARPSKPVDLKSADVVIHQQALNQFHHQYHRK